GRGQRLHIELAGCVLHPRGGHGIDLAMAGTLSASSTSATRKWASEPLSGELKKWYNSLIGVEITNSRELTPEKKAVFLQSEIKEKKFDCHTCQLFGF
ncbi:MAG: hypothetical protein IKS44_02625, partial [Bacteroidales bacterium]|nr:hypothetical protein [Bacteroidales bacterium]